jgi:predicted component of type VI protein secretion system
MLRLMLETEEDAPPADAKAVVTARQQKKRLRDKVAKLAGLTPDELKAASLVRTHHTVATAAAAAPGLDVPRLFASAKRKVFALFDIETED